VGWGERVRVRERVGWMSLCLCERHAQSEGSSVNLRVGVDGCE
jgi:hypothetical protein